MWWGLVASMFTLFLCLIYRSWVEENHRQAWQQALGKSFLEKEISFSKKKLANLAHDKRFAKIPEEFYEAKRYLLVISPSQILLYYQNSKGFDTLVTLSHKKLAFLLEEAMCNPLDSDSEEAEEKQSNILYFANYQKRAK